MSWRSFQEFWHNILCFLSLTTGCSSMDVVEHPLSFSEQKVQGSLSQVWEKKISGVITDLSGSPDQDFVYLATIPETSYEFASAKKETEKSVNPQGSRVPFLLKVNGDGSIEWKKELTSRVRYLLSDSRGERVLVATYDERVTYYSDKGEEIFKTPAHCRPAVGQAASEKWFCFYDDDSSFKFAVSLYDWTGRRTKTIPLGRGDLISYRLASDGNSLILGWSGGLIQVFDSDLNLKWENRVEGELIDVALAESEAAIVAFSQRKGNQRFQKLAVFGADGKMQHKAELKSFVSAVFQSPEQNFFSIYGNSPRGQSLSGWTWDEKEFKEAWRFEVKPFADYSSPVVVAHGQVWMGFEDLIAQDKKEVHNHLFAFSLDGKILFDLPLRIEEGAYLFSPVSSTMKKENEVELFVASDQSRLSKYRGKLR